MEIKRENVTRVYSGKSGCMCGCQGKYSDKPAMMTRIFNEVNNHPNKKTDENVKCIYLDVNGRNKVVYFS